MASRKKTQMTAADILAFLREGGSAEDLMGSGGFTQQQLLGVLLSDPEALGQFVEESRKATSPYETFQPDFGYEPESFINDIEFKYQQYGPKYQNLSRAFFGRVKETGGNPVDIMDYVGRINADPARAAQEFGLSEDELLVMLPELEKDASKFMDSEISKQKKQFAAYQKQREKLAADREGSALKGYIKQATGFSELADLPTTSLGLAQQRVGEQAKEYGEKQGKALGLSPLQSRQLENIFVTEYSRKSRAKGISPEKAGAVDLLKAMSKKKEKK